ncbi:MAG: efflux RND transporter periplasmic adaptor subunit [Cyanobacteria bacterium J06638_28]
MEPTAPDDIQIQSSTPTPPFLTSQASAEPDIFMDAKARQWAGARLIIGSGMVALVGIVGWLGYERFLKAPPAPVAAVTAPVARQDLEVKITEAGVVELGGQQTFKAPSDVTVQAVLVEERQRVSQGQPLLELRDRVLQQTLDDQQVQNRIDQLTLQRNLEILAEKRSRLEDTRLRLADAEDLFEQGYISENALRQDKRAVEDAQSEVRDAEVEVTKAEFQVQQNQVKAENIRLQLEDNLILAPIEAIVLKVDVKAGDGVQREGRLLSIGDPTQETIRLQLTTLNASKVGIGMPVRVSVIGPNPEIFEGRIVRVSPQAVSEQQDNAEQATVEAEARLNQPSNTLIPGSAVSVDIVLEQRTDAVTVPVTALQRDAANPYVWVRDSNNRAQKREVQIGLETLESIEILSGLAVGDAIVVSIPPEVTLTPGQPLALPGSEADVPAREGGDR